MGDSPETTQCVNTAEEDSEQTQEDNMEQQGLPVQEEQPAMSKNQQKKFRRQQEKLKFRAEARKLERERRKENRKRFLQDGGELPVSRKKLKKITRTPCDITVAIDSSFDSYMNENEIKKLVKQIQHCYAINRRTDVPFKYHVTGLDGRVKDRISNLEGTDKWEVVFHNESYTDVFTKDQLVYLSSESENVLESLEDGKVYMIGGLIDHNREKGLCHKLAEGNGVTHAKLPIEKYIEMKSRKVLTIDHVFEILVKYQEMKDWERAFFTVIPKRKGAQAKEDTEPSSPASTSLPKPSTPTNVEQTSTDHVVDKIVNNIENKEQQGTTEPTSTHCDTS